MCWRTAARAAPNTDDGEHDEGRRSSGGVTGDGVDERGVCSRAWAVLAVPSLPAADSQSQGNDEQETTLCDNI